MRRAAWPMMGTLVPNDHGFEIKGISGQMMRMFSSPAAAAAMRESARQQREDVTMLP